MDRALTSFVEPLAKRWTGHAVGPAVVVWSIGALCYLLGSGATRCPPTGRPGWCRLATAGAVGASLSVVLALAVVVGSSLLVAAVTPRLIDVVVGAAWPLSGPLGKPAREHHDKRRERLALVDPAPARPGWLPALYRRDESDIWRQLRRYPARENLVAPSRPGNTLAAMNERVVDRHGLRLSACWEALLLVLSDQARVRLAEQSTTLLLRAQGVVWSLAACGWAALMPTWWLSASWVLGSVLSAVVLYLGFCLAVEGYADLVEGVVATHRPALYQTVGFPLPASVAEEPAAGAALSEYLSGDVPVVTFVWPEASDSAEIARRRPGLAGAGTRPQNERQT